MSSPAVADQLTRIAEFEAGARPTPVTAVLRTVGQTKLFARVYRRVGPRVDPWLLRRDQGRAIAKVYGLPALLLHSVGATSGEPRTSPLLYRRDGDAFAVVGTNFGQVRHPAWTANLLAHPDAEIDIGPVHLAVRAEPADAATWHRLWPQFCDVYPGYRHYLERCGDRVPRMFRLVAADSA